jgi:hypothetical protein
MEDHIRYHVSTNALLILSDAMSNLQNAVNRNLPKIQSDSGSLLGSALSSVISRVQTETNDASELYRSLSGAPSAGESSYRQVGVRQIPSRQWRRLSGSGQGRSCFSELRRIHFVAGARGGSVP